MKTWKSASAIAAAALTAVSVAGCSSAPAPLTYAPAAYGVPGHCYYADSPAEAVALQAAGLCPRSWAATLMPAPWQEEYYSYYDSPAYYDTYVPARVRTVYVQREATFGKSNQAAIKTRSKTATYRTSSGKTVKGTQLTGKVKYGSGTSFGSSGQKYGGGSLRSGTSKSGTSGSVSSKSGSTGSGSSRSGSLRSGSSGSHSGSHK
jgi:hypothetical protein